MSEQVTDLSSEEIDAVSGGGWGGWGDNVFTFVNQSNYAINVSTNIALGGYNVYQSSSTNNNQNNYSNVEVWT